MIRKSFSIILLSLSILLFSFSNITYAAEWINTFDVESDMYDISQTSDSGCIASGRIINASMTDSLWMLKLDQNGSIQWQLAYKVENFDGFYAKPMQVRNGNYIIAGEILSSATDSIYAVLFQIDQSGNIQWAKTYGSNRGFGQINKTADGGYILSGNAQLSAQDSSYPIWILKLTENGSIQWQKAYKLSNVQVDDYMVPYVEQTSDGGYIASSKLYYPYDDPVTGDTVHKTWVLKLDSNGNVQWQKVYGDKYVKGLISQTIDGGFVLSGYAGEQGGFIVKLTEDGTIQWSKNYLDANYSGGSVLIASQTSDGGYIGGGELNSVAWILKTDSNGIIIWQKTYLSNKQLQKFGNVRKISDGGFIGLGITYDDSDRLYPFILKTDSNGSIDNCSNIGNSNAVASDFNIPVESPAFTVTNTDVSSNNINISVTYNINYSTKNVCYADPVKSFTLNVSKSGMGSGIITSSDGKLNCGFDCQESYNSNTTVTLTATPSSGSTFTGWSGSCSGTGTCTTTINGDTNITATFTAVPVGNPKISVKPAALKFSSMKAGSISNPKTISVKNTGTGSLIFNSINIAGSDSSDFNQTNDCSIISSGDSCTINVTFGPTSLLGKKSANISISSNDSKSSTMNVKLSGQTDPPKISVSPKSVNLGTVIVGNTSPSKTIAIKNTGTSDLSINSISITGTNQSEFIQTNNCNTVAKGSSCNVTVAFAPVAVGNKSAVINISSNDPKKLISVVKLSGKGK
jgi:hypothetical protein